MDIPEKYADIVNMMRGMGYEIRYSAPYEWALTKPGVDAEFFLDEYMAELFDARYQQGFKDGLERGAYEEMTQEDADPLKHAMLA